MLNLMEHSRITINQSRVNLQQKLVEKKEEKEARDLVQAAHASQNSVHFSVLC